MKLLIVAILLIISLLTKAQVTESCSLGNLGEICFVGSSVTLDKRAVYVAEIMSTKVRNNPLCKVTVTGFGASSKKAQQLSWDRVNSVIKYLVEKEGINEDRFIFNFAMEDGDPNTVVLIGVGPEADGPSTVPAPHPNLRKKK